MDRKKGQNPRMNWFGITQRTLPAFFGVLGMAYRYFLLTPPASNQPTVRLVTRLPKSFAKKTTSFSSSSISSTPPPPLHHPLKKRPPKHSIPSPLPNPAFPLTSESPSSKYHPLLQSSSASSMTSLSKSQQSFVFLLPEPSTTLLAMTRASRPTQRFSHVS